MVPKGKAAWFEKRLQQLGAKVTRLREDWNHLLTRRKDGATLTPEQKAAVDKASNSPETVHVGVLQMPDAATAELALTRFEQSVGTKGRAGPQEDPYAKVVLPMERRRLHQARAQAASGFHAGRRHLDRRNRGDGRAGRAHAVEGRPSVGLLRLQGAASSRSNHVGGDIHAMAEIDRRKLPPDHAPDPAQRDPSRGADPMRRPRCAPAPPEPEVAPFPDAERQALEAKQIIDRSSCCSTPGMWPSSYIRDPADLLALAIEQANQTFRNSGLGNINLRLVHTQLIDYDETGGDQFDHLYRMVDGVGAFKDVKKLRDEKRADIVGLILDNPTGCGLSTRVGAEADEAYLRRAPRLRRDHRSRSRTRSATSSAPGTTASWTPTTSRLPSATATSTAPNGAT